MTQQYKVKKRIVKKQKKFQSAEEKNSQLGNLLLFPFFTMVFSFVILVTSFVQWSLDNPVAEFTTIFYIVVWALFLSSAIYFFKFVSYYEDYDDEEEEELYVEIPSKRVRK